MNLTEVQGLTKASKVVFTSPSGHAQIVPLGFPHHVEDEPFPHIIRDAHRLCGINFSNLISQICCNSGWQRWASLLIELQQCASHLRVDENAKSDAVAPIAVRATMCYSYL